MTLNRSLSWIRSAIYFVSFMRYQSPSSGHPSAADDVPTYTVILNLSMHTSYRDCASWQEDVVHQLFCTE